jgi:hypothetical protein
LTRGKAKVKVDPGAKAQREKLPKVLVVPGVEVKVQEKRFLEDLVALEVEVRVQEKRFLVV